MKRSLKANNSKKDTDTKTITEYVCINISSDQCIGNCIRKGTYTIGWNFNEPWTYHSIGFCTSAECDKIDTNYLNLSNFQSVLNFINKNWGWKVLSIIPNKSAFGDYMYYTFYREIKV